MGTPNRNRVLGERLWDVLGQVWTRELGRWVSEDQVGQLLADGHAIVIFGYGRPIGWVQPQQALAVWFGIRAHFQTPGVRGATPDADGLTYAAVIWRRGSELLLGIEVFC